MHVHFESVVSENNYEISYFTLHTGLGEQQRYKTCIGVVQDLLPIALARPYSKYVLPEGTKVSKVHYVIV